VKSSEERSEAIRSILLVLRNRMAAVSPAASKGIDLAEEHGITVRELIEEFRRAAMNI
jgi:hypothetical protein